MDEAVFMNHLKKYPVVRDKNYRELYSVLASKPSKVTPTITEVTSIPTKKVSTNVPSDFWVGLKQLLEENFDPATAKKINQQFEDLHFKSIKQLNFEDINDIAAMFESEIGN